MNTQEKIQKIQKMLKKKGLENKDIQEGYMILSELETEIKNIIKQSQKINDFLDFLPLIEKKEFPDNYDLGNLKFKISEALQPVKTYSFMSLMTSNHKKNPMVLFENINIKDSDKFDKIIEVSEYIEDFYKNKKSYLFQRVFGYDIKSLEEANKNRKETIYYNNEAIYVVTRSTKDEIFTCSYSYLEYGYDSEDSEIFVRKHDDSMKWSRVDKNAEINGMYFGDKIYYMEFMKICPEHFI